MNAPALTPDLAPAWTSLDLLSHLWQSTAVALAVIILLLACRGFIPARTRRLLCWLALAKFAVPLTFFHGSVLSLGRFEHWLLPPVEAGAADVATVAAAARGAIDAPGAAGIAAAVAPMTVAPTGGLNALEWIIAIWLMGAVLVITSWIVRAIAARRRILATAAPLSPYVQWHVRVAARRLGLRRTPDGVAVDDDFAPAVVGLLAPVVILPRGLEGDLAPAELHSVVLHELVHVQRRDSFSSAVQTVIVGILWFNPVVWLISQLLHLESEKSCDERVLELTGDPDSYAGGILKCVRRALGLPQPVYPSVANPPVASRIKAILSHGTRPERRFAGKLAVLGALVLGCLGGLAGTFAATAPAPPVVPSEPVRSGAVLTAANGLVSAGDRITVDFPDTEIRNIITSVGDLFNLNVEIPPVLPGRVSVKLRDATWRDIYTSVLRPAGYSFVEQGKVVRIIPTVAPQPVAYSEINRAFVESAAGAAQPARIPLNGLGPVFDPANLDQIPTVTMQLKPDFPLEPRRQGTGGTVAVGFIVDRIGNVPTAWAVKSSDPAFEKNAVAAVMRWTFKPGMKGGQSVSTNMVVDIVFNAADGTEPANVVPATPRVAPAPAEPTRAAPGPGGALPVRVESIVATADRIDLPIGSLVAGTRASLVESLRAPRPTLALAAALLKTDGAEADAPSSQATPGGTVSAPSAPDAAVSVPDDPQAAGRIPTGTDAPSRFEPSDAAPPAPAEAPPPVAPQPHRAPGFVTSSAQVRHLESGATQFLARDGSEIFTLQPDGVLVLGDQVYEPSRLTERPRAKLQFKPDYPAEGRRQGISGTVSIDFVVDPKGDVIAAWARSSTRPLFEPSAVAAVLRWKFAPAKVGSKPVATHMLVDVVFNLNDGRLASN